MLKINIVADICNYYVLLSTLCALVAGIWFVVIFPQQQKNPVDFRSDSGDVRFTFLIGSPACHPAKN